MYDHPEKTHRLNGLHKANLVREAEVSRMVPPAPSGVVSHLALTTGEMLIAAGTKLKSRYALKPYQMNLEVK